MFCEIENRIHDYVTDNNVSSIPKIDSNITYKEFFENYLIKNKPCILLNISTNWPCKTEWLNNDLPNFTKLSQKYEHLQITVSDCNTRSYNAHKTDMLNFGEYLSYWQKYIDNEYSDEMPLLYLKDWHLKKMSGENFYTVPIFFSSDWLNEYFSEKTEDDYKFVYMGPTGTWTPFHADVFTSFSWSVNICGKKKWILFPPGEENFLKDNLGNLPYDITQCKHERIFFEIIQEPGEAIFVPSGWHHQVWNLEDTISVNHNWINGCNVNNMWKSLTNNLDSVKKEISDCQDMDGWLNHCQLMLKSSYGLDFLMFYDFLQHIASKRIEFLNGNVEIKQFDTWLLGKNHAIFDLHRIKDTLDNFMLHTDFHELHFINNTTPQELLSKIITTLSDIN